MYLVLAFGAVVCAWSLLLILSGERQRRLAEALSPPPTPAAHPQHALPAPPPAKAAPKPVDSRKKN